MDNVEAESDSEADGKRTKMEEGGGLLSRESGGRRANRGAAESQRAPSAEYEEEAPGYGGRR